MTTKQPQLFEVEPGQVAPTETPAEKPKRERTGPRRQRPYRLKKNVTRRVTDELVVELRKAGLLVRRYGRRKAVTLTWDTLVEVAVEAALRGNQPGKLFNEPATPNVAKLSEFSLAHLEKISHKEKKLGELCQPDLPNVEPEPSGSTLTFSEPMEPASAVRPSQPLPLEFSVPNASAISRRRQPVPRFRLVRRE